jgi:hypothetical protein
MLQQSINAVKANAKQTNQNTQTRSHSERSRGMTANLYGMTCKHVIQRKQNPGIKVEAAPYIAKSYCTVQRR